MFVVSPKTSLVIDFIRICGRFVAASLEKNQAIVSQVKEEYFAPPSPSPANRDQKESLDTDKGRGRGDILCVYQWKANNRIPAPQGKKEKKNELGEQYITLLKV